MSLSAREIALLLEELAPLAGSRVETVRVHAERALTLALHGPAGAALLLVSAEPELTRIHVARVRPPQPEKPFPFQAAARRELEGARLAALEPLERDRVVSLRFERTAGPVRLVAELTGRGGNLFLVGEGGEVLASAAPSLAARRRLFPGAAYEPPAAPPARSEGPERFAPGEGDGERFPRSAAAERHYRALEESRVLAEGRRRLRDPVRAAIARGRRAMERLEEEAARAEGAEGDRRAADLIKANLRAIPRGAREVTLTEWTAEGPRDVTVALDPALSPEANMERRYRHHRRIAASAARVAERQAEVRARQAGLAALLARVESATLEDLPRLEREARRLGAAPRPAPAPRRARPAPALPYRSFRSLSGRPLLVGRGAAENDALTLRVARGNDLWLHARGVPGAHVVVLLEKGAGPDQETLLDAAHLAVHFSDVRGAPRTDVAYTRAKYVRKARKAAPGAVTISQEKVISLRLEPRRLERLLAEEESEPSPGSRDGGARRSRRGGGP